MSSILFLESSGSVRQAAEKPAPPKEVQVESRQADRVSISDAAKQAAKAKSSDG